MRDHTNHIELPRHTAVEEILSRCDFHPETETVELAQAYDRVLASDVHSKVTLPNSLTCRLDSIAVHFDDFEEGIPDTTEWKRGIDWQFANTGVAMPEGFDTAIVIEHVDVDVSDDDSHITIHAAPSKRFAGTGPAGSRVREGDLLVQAGSVLTPLLLAHIAGGGVGSVEVIARPKVAFIPTGSELVPITENVPTGKNIDSNSILVRGKIEAWGGTALMHDIVADDPDRIEAALRECTLEADIVVINAGSSKGSDDWTMEILERIGEVICHETDHGPGHHSSYAIVDGTPIVGISGPPMGAAFTTDFYLRPLMMRFLGQPTEPQRLRVRLSADIPASSHSGKDKGDGKPAGAGDGKTARIETTGDEKTVHGEDRPSVAREGHPFYSIMHLDLSYSDDGVCEATPLLGHPDAVHMDASDACYALDSSTGAQPPKAGEMIEVELRG